MPKVTVTVSCVWTLPGSTGVAAAAADLASWNGIGLLDS